MERTLFGTDGIRSRVGQKPLSLEMLISIGRALGKWIVEKYGSHVTILIAQDTRISCSFVKAALKTGLLLSPVALHDAHILPTPTLFQLVVKNQFACGIMISASHNPFYDNGIKIMTRAGKLSLQEEASLTELITYNQHPVLYDHFGTDHIFSHAHELYYQQLLHFFPPHFLEKMTIVLDCAHGANYELAPFIFTRFGAHVISIHNTPNGTNINDLCGSLFPTPLQKTVLQHAADIGFAFDGDGDRVIAVNKKGEVKNGDDVVALLATNALYANEPACVGTILTNSGLDAFLKTKNKKLLRASVGDKYITQLLHTHQLLLAGEPSGHVIMRDYSETGDGIYTALRICQTMIETHNENLTTFSVYPQAHINMPVTSRKNLSEPPFASIINSCAQLLTSGRLIVRYSGTEHVLRITAEDSDFQHAQAVALQVSEELQKLL